MSKTQKLKVDYDDTAELLEIMMILKDVASNHFVSSSKIKQRFVDFAEAFIDFFKMVSLAEARHPLVHSDVQQTCVLITTSESGFMGDMNSKLVRAGIQEAEKINSNYYVIIGKKGADKLKQTVSSPNIQVFTDIEEHGLYNLSLMIKDYLIKQVLDRKIGRVIAVYPFAQNLQLIKPKATVLLPSEELLTQQREVKDTIEKVIVESDFNDIMGYLADIWLTCRIYEMLEDSIIAGYAAQAQQLEAATDRLKKEKQGLGLAFKKSQKADMDKSLREVFTASMMRASGGKR